MNDVRVEGMYAEDWLGKIKKGDKVKLRSNWKELCVKVMGREEAEEWLENFSQYEGEILTYVRTEVVELTYLNEAILFELEHEDGDPTEWLIDGFLLEKAEYNNKKTKFAKKGE